MAALDVDSDCRCNSTLLHRCLESELELVLKLESGVVHESSHFLICDDAWQLSFSDNQEAKPRERQRKTSTFVSAF